MGSNKPQISSSLVNPRVRLLYTVCGPRKFMEGEIVTVVARYPSGNLDVQGDDGNIVYVADFEVDA